MTIESLLIDPTGAPARTVPVRVWAVLVCRIAIANDAMWRRLVLSRRRMRTRRALARLSADLLDDIGLSRSEALNEAHKPFWR